MIVCQHVIKVFKEGAALYVQPLFACCLPLERRNMVAKKRKSLKAAVVPFSLLVKNRHVFLRINNRYFRIAVDLPIAAVISIGALLGSPLVVEVFRTVFNVR